MPCREGTSVVAYGPLYRDRSKICTETQTRRAREGVLRDFRLSKPKQKKYKTFHEQGSAAEPLIGPLSPGPESP